MSIDKNLPHGIRINNPGNLRAAYGMKYPTKLDNGLAIFQSMSDGVQALAALTFDFYTAHGLRTLPAFIERYAPASENDVLAYQRNMVALLGCNPLSVATTDLRLDRSWNALKFMRAIIIVEQGHPPSGWIPDAEWIDLTTWMASMHRAARWRIV